MSQGELEHDVALKRIAGLAIILTLTCALATVVTVRPSRADDDWEAVTSNAPTASAVARASAPAIRESAPAAPADASPAADGASPNGTSPDHARTFTICGERATAAAPRIKSMVNQINGVWGTSFPVYQTLTAEQPHAATGGCVFYNAAAMESILAHRLIVNDQAIVDPLVWAIFAHEIGHQVHHDTEKSRQAVASLTKELEADRFSGYTLEKLQIPATDLTAFWDLTGDEFGGPVTGANQHGVSSQRVAAFKEGWHLAEWNRPENSQSVTDAQDEPTAPEGSAAAPE